MAGLLPGEPLNLNRIEIFKQRLANPQYFVMPARIRGKPIDVKVINRRPGDKPYGDGRSPTSTTVVDDPDAGARARRPRRRSRRPAGRARCRRPGGRRRPAGPEPVGARSAPGGSFDPPPDAPPIDVADPPARARPGVVPAGAAPSSGVPPTPPVGAGEPPGTFPSIPGLNMTDVGPDRQDPFPNRIFADIVTSVDEAPTGRFMLGVGASGFQGLNGNLTITRRTSTCSNFPALVRRHHQRQGVPRGRAGLPGLELMAGHPDQPVHGQLRATPTCSTCRSASSASGYLFQRIYPDWTEARGGGRFSLGRQFGTQTYADVAFRIEDVNFYGYQTPGPGRLPGRHRAHDPGHAPPEPPVRQPELPVPAQQGAVPRVLLRAGLGDVHLSRRSRSRAGPTSRPAAGPTARASGSSRSAATSASTGRDTPVYERFFAGDFGSLRGFQYRGVGPHVLGVERRRHHDGDRLGRVPVPLDGQRHAPAGRLLRLRHGRERLRLQQLPRLGRHRPPL